MDYHNLHPTVQDFIAQLWDYQAFERDGWGNIRFIREG